MEKYNNSYCKYCCKEAIMNFAEALKCNVCVKCVHISCLKRQAVPGGIFGDTFFNFTCQECSESGNEVFVRKKITWFQVIILIMYHLHNKTAGTANKGFFHWKIHVVAFIDKKWNTLFSKNMKRRKNWMGTVSGSISHFSPCFFTSGTPVLRSNGWWKLTFPELTPTTTFITYNSITTLKQSTLKTYDDISHIKHFISRNIPGITMEEDTSPEISQESDDKMKLFMEEINVDVEDELQLIPCRLFDASSSSNILQHDLKINQVLDHVSPLKKMCKPKKCKKLAMPQSNSKHLKNDFYKFWRKHERKIERNNVDNCVSLQLLEENTLHSYIMQRKRCKKRSDMMLKRKLHVRYLKRKYSVKPLNIDDIDDETVKQLRTRHYTTVSTAATDQPKEHHRVISRGSIRMDSHFRSPYTNRVLKPFIRRDQAPKSLWLDLMTELVAAVETKDVAPVHWTTSSLDYVYVQPNQIPVINELCEKYFWPGVDLSEALEYPEFSCVVLYKKLIVAFAFMVPDIKFNENYISFIFTRPEWRGGGIGKFLIYHLIQTCIGKDVTLHVAIDNPAIFLYQKFGFKVEEVVLNFYDTYLRDSSKCKHAFFLRLER